MYLRRCYRNKDGKRHGYWALVESYRSSRGPRQRVVAYLGEMDAAGRLLAHKEELEKHLKNRLGALFDLDYDLLLYDVTSTYFEGEAQRNESAQRGYSRDQRPDCKQVNIALVVSREGMPLGYQLFTGNRNDGTTLEEIVNDCTGEQTVSGCWIAAW